MIYHANFTKPNNGYTTFGGLISLSDFDTSRKKNRPLTAPLLRDASLRTIVSTNNAEKIENIQNGQENGKRI